MKIKAIFPGNFYSRRKIKIYDENNHFIESIYPNQTIDLNTNSKKLKFQIDYHKKTVELNNNENLIVYFKYKPYFPFNYIDLMKNALEVKKTDIDNFEEEINKLEKGTLEKKIIINKHIYFSLFLQALASILLMYTTIFKQELVKFNVNLIFFIGLISLLSIFITLFNLKKTFYNEYNIRIIAAAMLFGSLSFFTKSYVSILLIIISLMLLFEYYKIKTDFQNRTDINNMHTI
jgi:hypothetical protein